MQKWLSDENKTFRLPTSALLHGWLVGWLPKEPSPDYMEVGSSSEKEIQGLANGDGGSEVAISSNDSRVEIIIGRMILAKCKKR